MSDSQSEYSGIPTGDGFDFIAVRDLVYEVGKNRLLAVESLNISRDGPTTIIGPNGAGKSLFLRLLHGLIEPTSGTILMDGRPIDESNRIAQAMVFQKPILLRRTVAGNIDYALKAHGVARIDRKQKVRQILARSGLAEHADQPARSLSGGEQQRLALVRALASVPKVLFLDEPTSSLDPAASDAIEALILRAASAGTKIVTITHDLGLARRMAGEILFFHLGRLCEQATCDSFFQEPATNEGRAFLASKLALWKQVDGRP